MINSKEEFKNTVSVVIPVYNAEKFIQKAAHSALSQEEVLEILLIEDGSKDGSLAVCQELEKSSKKIRILRHSQGENLGAGPSRNLGIRSAIGQFIAFLDADDFYLHDRFRHLKNLSDNRIDGGYEIVGVQYDNLIAKEKHLSRMKKIKKNISNTEVALDHTGISQLILPQKLFFHLLKTDLGWIHLNGLTIKQTSLVNYKLFNHNILGQDTEFISRLSSTKTLINTTDGRIKAVRRVHSGNRILEKNESKRVKKSNYSKWIWHCVKIKKYGIELRYLMLRQADSKNSVAKFGKLVLNSALLFLGIFLKKEFKLK